MLAIKLEMPEGQVTLRDYPKSWVRVFLNAMQEMRERGGRIFHIRYSDGVKHYLLTTTSKDLSFTLNEMPDGAMAALCYLLAEGFKTEVGQIMITDPETKKGLLAIPVKPEPTDHGQVKYEMFHLSPA